MGTVGVARDSVDVIRIKINVLVRFAIFGSIRKKASLVHRTKNILQFLNVCP